VQPAIFYLRSKSLPTWQISQRAGSLWERPLRRRLSQYALQRNAKLVRSYGTRREGNASRIEIADLAAEDQKEERTAIKESNRTSSPYLVTDINIDLIFICRCISRDYALRAALMHDLYKTEEITPQWERVPLGSRRISFSFASSVRARVRRKYQPATNSKRDMSPSEFFKHPVGASILLHPAFASWISAPRYASVSSLDVLDRNSSREYVAGNAWIISGRDREGGREGGRLLRGTFRDGGYSISRKSGLVRFRFVEFNPSPCRKPRTCVRLAPAFRHSFSPPFALATGCPADFGFLLLDDVAAGIRDSVCTDLYVDRTAVERSSKSVRNISKCAIFPISSGFLNA